MHEVFVGLGGNLGDPVQTFRGAVARLAEVMEVGAVSSLYRTEPVGRRDQPDFLNAALRGQTRLSASELLAAFLAIERWYGRERTESMGPRTLDLDLLLYGDQILDQPGLTVPHPEMTKRRFVLLPLAEIAPDAVHPECGQKVSELLSALEGSERVDRAFVAGWPPENPVPF